MKAVYLDWAATTPPLESILHATSEFSLKFYGNPSSQHPAGKAARLELEKCRNTAAAALACAPERLIFTSGGTESNNLVIQTLLRKKKPGKLLLTPLEHPSAGEPLLQLRDWGFRPEYLKLDPATGLVDRDGLRDALSEDTQFVALIHTHNETGVIQDLSTCIDIIREFSRGTGKPIHVHSDAVQSLGKTEYLPTQWDVDSAAFSSHKIRGPRGAGLLYLKNPLNVLTVGGGQEMGLRPGTENLAAIFGMVEAMRLMLPERENAEAVASRLRWRLMEGIQRCCPTAEFPFASSPHQSPFILAAALAPYPGEVLVRILGDAGFSVSTGSACSSNRRERYRDRLKLWGISAAYADSLIRISTGFTTTDEEIERFLDTLAKILRQLPHPTRRK